MKLFWNYIDAASAISTPHVTAIGNFDGVHVGHQSLLRAARQEADRLGLPLAVLTFDPHPSAVINPETARLNLVDSQRKRELLTLCGVDLALFQHFDKTFAALSAEFFAAEILAKALCSRLVVVGRNFRFGKDREAGIDTLISLGKTSGFQVCAAPLIPSDAAVVSSSKIRALLSQGNVRKATELLGRYHEVRGRVVRDREIGRTFGFPTINLTDVCVMVPKSGIYAAFCRIGNRRLKAAVYIGTRPTVDAGFSIEAHLLDFDGDLYDSDVILYFVEWIRADEKFSGTDALVAQIKEDISRIRKILEREA